MALLQLRNAGIKNPVDGWFFAPQKTSHLPDFLYLHYVVAILCALLVSV
jgi:hypothetical protein